MWGDKQPRGPGKTPVEVDRLSCRLLIRAVSEEEVEAFSLSHFMPRFLDIVRTCLQPEAEYNEGMVPVGLGANFFASLGGAPELSGQASEKMKMGGNVTLRW